MLYCSTGEISLTTTKEAVSANHTTHIICPRKAERLHISTLMTLFELIVAWGYLILNAHCATTTLTRVLGGCPSTLS